MRTTVRAQFTGALEQRPRQILGVELIGLVEYATKLGLGTHKEVQEVERKLVGGCS